jgi:FG-GAP-like repeat
MRAIVLYGIIALSASACTTPGNTIPTPAASTETATPSPVTPSHRVRYALNTQGLPGDGFWKSTPTLVDINQDGVLDLASHSRDASSAHVWLGQPNNTWQDSSQGLPQENATCGGGIKLGRLNKDTAMDLVVADHCAGLFVFLGDAQNSWHLAKKLSSKLEQKTAALKPDVNVLSGNEDVALGDINEDGFLDIIASAADEGGFTVFLGNGSGKKWQETKTDGLPSAADPGEEDAHGGWAVDVQLHDMNNDKHLDIVASFYSGPRVWLGDGKGHWTSKSTGLTVTDMGGSYRKLAVADINGDGLKDLAVTNDVSGAESYLQNADGSWQKPTDMLPPLKVGASSVALGDLDGDGHTDAVIAGRLMLTPDNNSTGLHVVLGDGKGHWQYEPGSQLPSQDLAEVWGIALADLNGDKRLDIVATTGAAPSKPTKKKPGHTELPRLQVWLSEALDATTSATK